MPIPSTTLTATEKFARQGSNILIPEIKKEPEYEKKPPKTKPDKNIGIEDPDAMEGITVNVPIIDLTKDTPTNPNVAKEPDDELMNTETVNELNPGVNGIVETQVSNPNFANLRDAVNVINNESNKRRIIQEQQLIEARLAMLPNPILSS